MHDRRSSARRKTYFGGRLVINDRWSTMDCVLRNISAHGAKLASTAPATAAVPDEFDLEVFRMGLTFRARTIWRRRNELGVCFIERPEQETQRDLSIRLRKLNAERSRLVRRIAELSG
jgi:hypothetical protein